MILLKLLLLIVYTDVGDHHKTGKIDTFIRILRERINKYCEMHSTTTSINVLYDIVHNYNNTFNK